MEQVATSPVTPGRLAFQCMGGFVLFLSLVFNPLVLRPRMWSVAVMGKEFATEATLILVGLGLLSVRRWAALALSVLAGCVGGNALYEYARYRPEFIVSAIVWFVVLLIPAVVTAIFWRSLVRGKRRDLLYLLIAVGLSALIVCAAGGPFKPGVGLSGTSRTFWPGWCPILRRCCEPWGS